jgi:hypothetical protein
MACQWRCSIPSKASLAPKGKKLFLRALSFITSRRNPISMQSNNFLMKSIRLVSVLILFVTVLLVNIGMPRRPMNPSSSYPPHKKMFSLNGLPSLQKLVIASANKHYERKPSSSVVRNLVKPGSESSFHAILRLFLESQVVWIQSAHRHSTNLQSPDILTSLRQSSTSMRFLQRTSITWMRKGYSRVVVRRLRHKSTSFLRTSIQNTSFTVPTSSLLQLWSALQQMGNMSVQGSFLKESSNMSRHGLKWILRYCKSLLELIQIQAYAF